MKFQLFGNMTMHGVTKAVTWDVSGQILDQALKATASTAIRVQRTRPDAAEGAAGA